VVVTPDLEILGFLFTIFLLYHLCAINRSSGYVGRDPLVKRCVYICD
jgi:hypothetical protein